MMPSSMRIILGRYDELAGELKDLGFEVKEVSWVSDDYYELIKVSNSEGRLFVADDIYDFIGKATVFLEGIRYSFERES